MNAEFKKIMLVTNEPSDARGAEQTALSLAKKTQAEVLLVDSIRTPFCPARFPALKTELIYEAAVASKQSYLNELKARFECEGITTTMEVLVGPRSSVDLVQKSVSANVGLVVRYIKGQSSRAEGRFGETAANLMRICPVPVLLTDRLVEEPRVLACINLEHGSHENKSILEQARKMAPSPNDLLVLCCWDFSGQEVILDYVDEGLYDQTKDGTRQIYQCLFNTLVKSNKIQAGQAHLLEGKPPALIPQFCTDHKIDLAVMCSAALNHPAGRNLGSTIEQTIGKLPCALLTVKPKGFKSPMR